MRRGLRLRLTRLGMTRPRKTAALRVYVGQQRIGMYDRKADGGTGFRYAVSWLDSPYAFPLSLSLPLSTRRWTGAAVQHVFDGLLPDNHATREKLAAHTGAESAGIFDLLAKIGRDCVGAYRFLLPDEDPGDSTRMRARPLRAAEMAQRIAALGQRPLGIAPHLFGEDDFRISIAGNQDKTALLKIGDQWHLPEGSTSTSHIFKPRLPLSDDGVDMRDSPWNEWFCLKLCGALGMPAAHAEVGYFDGKPVLIVERFDRVWQDGVLHRLPQEDFCQALGFPPARKYESDGGPGILSVLDLLQQSAAPRADRLAFLNAHIVYWLLSAPDGHAKNFSVFLRPNGFSLTPVYDVLSAAPYHPHLGRQKVKLAVAVGRNRHYRIQEILPRHFYQTAQAAGMPKSDVDGLFDQVEQAIDAALQSTVVAAEKENMPTHTRDAIVQTVEKHARYLRLKEPAAPKQPQHSTSSLDPQDNPYNTQPQDTNDPVSQLSPS